MNASNNTCLSNNFTTRNLVNVETTNTVYNYVDFIIPCVTVPLLDILLCSMISSKARWFQLHAVTNLLIVFIIWSDVKKYYIHLFDAIKDKDSDLDNYFIIVLHMYHCIFFKNLTFLDYFHHLLFVITGVLPSMIIIKSNIIRLLTFTGCGLPGVIEYGTLVLMKHDYLTQLEQKNINSYMYVYFRNPLAIFNVSFMYISYNIGRLVDENFYIIFYVMVLTYFNGTFYNKLAVENHRNTYYKKYLNYRQDNYLKII